MEAIQHLTNSIQCSAWSLNCNANTLSIEYSRDIKHLIQEKRKARKRWQESRHPPDKSHLNKLSKKLQNFYKRKNLKIGLPLSAIWTARLQEVTHYGKLPRKWANL